MHYSVIVPVYNRPDEVTELLESLAVQEYTSINSTLKTENMSSKIFEIVIIEDGSTKPCKSITDSFVKKLNIKYIQKENTGRSDSRNVGMQNASGDYFVFFDSDCIIPPEYFHTLESNLRSNYADCFGGPDREHPSFNNLQKAISYAMTSFWTTGGIRGGKVNMEKFKPRTFNMGFSRKVWETVGGFKDMIGEDIDLSIRIGKAGFTTKLYNNVYVYHKRRVSIKRFYHQVNIFGQARVNLWKMYPDSLKAVHTLPALFVLSAVVIILLALFVSPWFLLLPTFYLCLLFTDAMIKTNNIIIALTAMFTSLVQITGYGFGFIKSLIQKILLKKEMEDVETLKKIYK